MSHISLRRALALALLAATVAGLLGGPPGADAQTPTRISIFGADIRTTWQSDSQYAAEVSRASEASLSWARYPDLKWAEIELGNDVFDTAKIAFHKARVKALIDQGMRPVVVVHTTPNWALPAQYQGNANYQCKAPANVAHLQDFMYKLVSAFRSSDPLYGGHALDVDYWQIWNEPDSTTAQGGGIGCFGDPAKPSYGAADYVPLLQAGYQGVKQADGGAQVVMGGLLLDCPSDACAQGSFFDGVLANGGGSFFDILDYHAYAWVHGEPVGSFAESWYGWGNIISGKARFLRSVMRARGIDKPIILGETALLCDGCDLPKYSATPDAYGNGGYQAKYIARAYVRGAAEGLVGVEWYTLAFSDFYTSDLVDGGVTPRGGFVALKFLAGELLGASYAGNLSSSLYEGYRFCKGQTEYRVYWTASSDRQVALSLPAGAQLFNSQGYAGQPALARFEPLIARTQVGTGCVAQRSASWSNNLGTGSAGAPVDFGGVWWMTAVGGPCESRPANTCQLDTRAVRTESNGDVLVSVTAHGRYWTYNQTQNSMTTNGTDLTSVTRWASGPCQGRAAGSCRFDTRAILNEGGQNVEYITAYGKRWRFNLATGAADVNNGSLLTDQIKWWYARSGGPCAGQPQADGCVLDSQVLWWSGGTLMESVTAGGRRWDYNLTSGQPTSTFGTALDSIARYSAYRSASDYGPCYGWPAGACQFRTRTLRPDASGQMIETITN